MLWVILERLLNVIGCPAGSLIVVDRAASGAVISVCFHGSPDPRGAEAWRLFLRPDGPLVQLSGEEQPFELNTSGGLVLRGISHADFLVIPFGAVRPLHVLLIVPSRFAQVPERAEKDVLWLRELAVTVLERHLMRRAAQRAGYQFDFVGLSEPVLRMEASIKRAASQEVPTLIVGERGVGKESVAFALHFRSKRREAPFVALNCAAFSSGLYAPELFGWRKGAFTGAVSDRPGRFEAANGGTLFFDEISECPSSIYPGLLRALEYGEIQKLGEDRPRKVNVRVVAATNRDIEGLASENRFPPDLLDRINVLSIRVPPLRERKEDIPVLVHYYLRKHCQDFQLLTHCELCSICREGGVPRCVPREFMPQLANYSWPGNIRELKSVVLRIMTTVELPTEILSCQPYPVSARSLVDSHLGAPVFHLETMVRNHLLMVLRVHGWNRSAAARALGIPLSTLMSKLKRLGVRPEVLRHSATC